MVGGRGGAIAAKGGTRVIGPHINDPNDDSGSLYVIMVVILPIAQMFFISLVIILIRLCYKRYCRKQSIKRKNELRLKIDTILAQRSIDQSERMVETNPKTFNIEMVQMEQTTTSAIASTSSATTTAKSNRLIVPNGNCQPSSSSMSSVSKQSSSSASSLSKRANGQSHSRYQVHSSIGNTIPMYLYQTPNTKVISVDVEGLSSNHLHETSDRSSALSEPELVYEEMTI
ncbi:hypothetical protein BLOT_008454 [Blomia tropicalis]|nr:hypothetical protein BLOT_008454 [Blomia tropicalis]